MLAAHNLVRLGYQHADVMAMCEHELSDWLDVAVQYNKLVSEAQGDR